ncbi:MAG: hypothetical protein IJ438_09545 [Clostridia bacterium]|nr:hypothetical protein [Clostridia bacterium]
MLIIRSMHIKKAPAACDSGAADMQDYLRFLAMTTPAITTTTATTATMAMVVVFILRASLLYGTVRHRLTDQAYRKGVCTRFELF